MRRMLLALAIAAGAVGGMTLAHHDEHGKGEVNVKVLSRKEIAEKVDGKKFKATTVEVTLEPGQASAPHRHPGPAFGYVLEGEYEWAIDDNLGTLERFGQPLAGEGVDARRGGRRYRLVTLPAQEGDQFLADEAAAADYHDLHVGSP